MADVATAVGALREAVRTASAFVSEQELRPAARLVDAISSRHGFLGETVVVAMAGGTGSGKSSLLNALAGEEVSVVGAVRPTTAEPLAWIPSNPEPGLVRLLDDLGVGRRAGHALDTTLAVIDLPDYDSVEFDHRAAVEALVPRVDAIVWVLDPQKYSDRSLYRDYLIPLAPYQGQFLFVLNQVDRIDVRGLEAVLGDLHTRLRTNGIRDPVVVTTAARPPAGGSRGVEALREVLAARFEAKQTVHVKLLIDVRRVCTQLYEIAGLSEGGPDLMQLLDQAQADVVSGLADLVAGPDVAVQAEVIGQRLASSRAAGPPGRLAALFRRGRIGRALGAMPDEIPAGDWWSRPGLERVLAGLNRSVTDLSTAVGEGLGRRIRADFGPERLDRSIRATVEGALDEVGALAPPPARRWWAAMGVVQLVIFAGLMSGLVWTWVEGVNRGDVPWHLILVAGSVILGAAIRSVTRASGRRAGRRRAREHRNALEEALAGHLRERVAKPIQTTIAVRDRLGLQLRDLDHQLSELE